MSPLPRIQPVPSQPLIQQLPLPIAFITPAAIDQILKRASPDQILTATGTSFPLTNVSTGQNLLIVGRIQGSAGTVNVGPRFNNDSANNYGFLNLFSSGAGAQGPAAGTTSFIQAGQATNTTSAAFLCFVPGYRVTGLTNNPTLTVSGSSLIVLVRASWWNQGLPITSVQVVADASMTAQSYCAILTF